MDEYFFFFYICKRAVYFVNVSNERKIKIWCDNKKTAHANQVPSMDKLNQKLHALPYTERTMRLFFAFSSSSSLIVASHKPLLNLCVLLCYNQTLCVETQTEQKIYLFFSFIFFFCFALYIYKMSAI